MTKFKIDKSPFKFERDYHAKSVSKSFRLPQDVYDELMDYYYSIHGEENNLTKAFNDIALEKLDNICRERKSYQDFNIMMLIPKTNDIDELNKKSEIVGFFTNDDISDLNQDLLVRDESDDEILMKVDLTNHNIKDDYDIIKYINPNCFRFDMNDVSSFDDFKIQLNKAYPNIELDNSYFINIELNNYFDIYRNGEFQSYLLNNIHISGYVFVDYTINKKGEMLNRKLFCFLQWNYTSNILDVDFNFTFGAHFMGTLEVDDARDNKEIKHKIGELINDGDRKMTLLKMKDDLSHIRESILEQLDIVYNILEDEYPEVFDD